MTLTPSPSASGGPNPWVSLVRMLGGAVGLVVVVALLFAGLGALRADRVAVGEGPLAQGDAAEDRREADDDVGATSAGQETGDDAGEPAAGEAEDAGTSDEEPAGDAAGEVERTIAPDEIRLQVLDGSRGDGTAAREIAARLRDAGYLVIAEHPAIAYEITTVLWSAGAEEKARQVAAEIGAREVRPQPGNLSETVDVHVVIGSDRN